MRVEAAPIETINQPSQSLTQVSSNGSLFVNGTAKTLPPHFERGKIRLDFVVKTTTTINIINVDIVMALHKKKTKHNNNGDDVLQIITK